MFNEKLCSFYPEGKIESVLEELHEIQKEFEQKGYKRISIRECSKHISGYEFGIFGTKEKE